MLHGINPIITRFTFPALLAIVLVVALILRLVQAKLGLPYIHYWDEPDIASRAIRMLQTGDMNPHFFNYGTLMLYLNYLLDQLYYLFAPLLPVDSNAYVADAGDIKTTFDTGWHWTISHPAIYYWNRALTVVMGVGTVAVVYLLGKITFGRWVGLVGASILAVMPIHISHAARITPNVPAIFFMLSTVLFCVLFIQKREWKYFYLALFFTGFSIATKYNAGLVLLMPLIVLAVMHYSVENFTVTRKHWMLSMFVPAAVVIIVMPYSLIDLPRFVQDVLTELTHYNRGHRGVSITPGWTHFSLQMGRVYDNIGAVAAVLAVSGFVAGLANRTFVFIVILPVLYILYMSSTNVSFHRNFLLIYPYIALSIGVAFYYLYRLSGMLVQKTGNNYPVLVKSFVTVLAATFIIISTSHAYKDASRMYHTSETRTVAIEELNKLTNIDRVVIAGELRLHKHDLDRLRHEYLIAPLNVIASRDYSENTVFLIPALLTAQYGTDFRVKESRLKQSIVDSVPEDHVLSVIGELPDRSIDYYSINHLEHSHMSSLTKLDIFSKDPAMLVVGTIPNKQLDPSVINFEVCQYPGLPTKLDHYDVLWLAAGHVTTPTYNMTPGSYTFSANAKSSVMGKEIKKTIKLFEFDASFAMRKTRNYGLERLKLSIFSNGALLAEDIYTITGNYESIKLPFELKNDSDVYATVTFIADETNQGDPPAIKVRELSISEKQR